MDDEKVYSKVQQVNDYVEMKYFFAVSFELCINLDGRTFCFVSREDWGDCSSSEIYLVLLRYLW